MQTKLFKQAIFLIKIYPKLETKPKCVFIAKEKKIN